MIPTKRSRAKSRGRGRIVLLGPQSRIVTAGQVVTGLNPKGRIATVTAGWQEREPEDDELDAVLGGGTVNLRLYGRAETVRVEDAELAQAHRALQESIKLLRRAYNARLSPLMDAWISVNDMKGDPAVLDPERDAALRAVRELDAAHIGRISELRAEFWERWRPGERDAVTRQRDEIEARLADASVVAIAGGHIAVLLNRLRTFEIDRLLQGKDLVAWSAGAMALAGTVVLFHDHPPQGPGHAEAFEAGLGFFDDLVPLPNGSWRLALDDHERTRRLARRFAPAMCVLLDDGSRIERRRSAWRAGDSTLRIADDGSTRRAAA
jgi:hypothetical protein